MNISDDFKMVIVLDENLPLGLKCNTSAVLALSLGGKIEKLIDRDLLDASGKLHTGLTNMPLPILKSNEQNLKNLIDLAKEKGPELLVVDITDAAQTTKNYADYEKLLKSKKTDELKILGVALAGTSQNVKSLTGNLPLLK